MSVTKLADKVGISIVNLSRLKKGNVKGIRYSTLNKICEILDCKVEIHDFNLEDLINADEVFFTGTASEVTPIRSIDDQLISNGDPGPITLKLRRYYMDIVFGKNS